jgi:hypothetical protein
MQYSTVQYNTTVQCRDSSDPLDKNEVGPIGNKSETLECSVEEFIE